MKTLLSLLMFVLLLSSLMAQGTPGLTFAAPWPDDGTLVVSRGTATGHIVVPATYEGKTVTQVGSMAFGDVSVLSVTLPNTITTIAGGAFFGASAMLYVNLPLSVVTVQASAFEGCDVLTIYAEAESQPAGWTSHNPLNRPVIYDYVNAVLQPSGLEAAYAFTHVELTWTAPDSPWTFSYFKVYRDNELIGDDITGTSFEDTTFIYGIDYEYYVTAYYSDLAVESGPSNIVEYRLEGILPTILRDFGALNVRGAGIRVYWTTELEINLLGYRIHRNEINDIGSAISVTKGFIEARNLSSNEYYSYLDREIVNSREYFYWLEALEIDGSSEVFGPVIIVSNIEIEPQIEINETFVLSVYPNPLIENTIANFDISVKNDETAHLRIFNIRGQLIKEFTEIPTGHHSIKWDGRDTRNRQVSSGIYFYQLSSPSYFRVDRMVIVK